MKIIGFICNTLRQLNWKSISIRGRVKEEEFRYYDMCDQHSRAHGQRTGLRKTFSQIQFPFRWAYFSGAGFQRQQQQQILM